MSLLQKALETLARVKGDISQELKKHEADLEALRKEREVTARLPIPQDEFLARVEAMVPPPEKFRAQLAAVLGPLQTPGRAPIRVNPLGITAAQAGVVPFDQPDPGAITSYALASLLGPLIRDALLDHAEALPYPVETGLPTEEREKRLREIDAEIVALDAKVSDLREQLQQAGLKV